jgi:hypothetical protein
VAFADPTRSVGSYHATLNKEETLEAFLTEARAQSRRRWLQEYTAQAVLEYIRAGFQPTQSLGSKQVGAVP